MANTQIVCRYSAMAAGITPAALAESMADVPLDLFLPGAVGLLPVSDETSLVGTTANRIVTLMMGQEYETTAGIDITYGAPAGPIRSASVQTDVPTDYAAQPILSFTDPKGRGATGVCVMQLGTMMILDPGSGYSPDTTARVVGGGLAPPERKALVRQLPTPHSSSGMAISRLQPGALFRAPGGRPAQVVPMFGASGELTDVEMVDWGSGYTTFPLLELDQPGGGTGSGALAVFTLRPLAYVIHQHGNGYVSPTLHLTPLFKSSFPDSEDPSSQASAVRGWMRAILANALATSILEQPPIVT